VPPAVADGDGVMLEAVVGAIGGSSTDEAACEADDPYEDAAVPRVDC